jgi:hypothetical protein
MNKKLFLALALAFAGQLFAGETFYVAPDGKDTNPGTRQEPLKTLEGARDAVRRVNKTMKGDIVVQFAQGTYNFNETVAFSAVDSGMNGHTITYKVQDDHKPVFSGATKVKGFELFKDNIYSAQLDRNEKLRSLIVNGKRAYMTRKNVQTQGKWGTYQVKAGEASWAVISGSAPDGIRFKADDLPDMRNPEDLEIIKNSTWNSHIVGIRGMTTENGQRILKFQQPYGAIASTIKWAGFWEDPRVDYTVCNAFELLREPGTFYFDRKKKTVYYIPRAGENMATADVYAPKVGTLISIGGTSKKERVQNLTFQGITFAYTESVLPKVGDSSGKTSVQAATHCVVFDDNNWHKTAYRSYDTMPNAVTVTSAQSIQFEDSVFKHIGNEGIGLINDVVDSKIVGNVFYDIGGGAVQVGHPQHVYEGDKHLLAKYPPEIEGICTNNLVKNNVMYDMTVLFYGHAPITAYFVDGLKIINNHIQKCAYTAISMGWGWNNFNDKNKGDNETKTCRNNVMSYNRVYDCMEKMHDGGAFYTLGSQPNSTTDGNYVKAGTHHFQGVYHPDEGTSGYTGKNMVFEVLPDQEIFELNKWKDKHSNHYSNIYTTSDKFLLSAPNCTITDVHHIKDAVWPEEALAIIRSAGVEKEYHHLLKVIPNITFKTKKRYDTLETIVSPVGPKYVPPTAEGRYEAEKAQLSNGAKVEIEHHGFSGKGYAGKYYKKKSATTTFTVKVNEMGIHKVLIQYAAGHGDCKVIALYVNGEKSKMLNLKSTGNWKAWNSHTVPVSLKAGLNMISLEAEASSEDCINLDYIKVSK